MSRYLFWITLALGTLLDVLLAAVLTYVSGGSEPVSTFLTLFAVLWFAPAAFAMWGAVKGFAIFAWPLKRIMTREYLRTLKAGSFPVVPTYDLDSYLAQTVDDDTVPISTRLKASFLAGQLNGLKVGKPVTVGMLNHIAAESALNKYQDQATVARG